MRKFKWTITKEGDLECKDAAYHIPVSRLASEDWVSHMEEKSWVNMADFLLAYRTACRLAGVERVMRDYGSRMVRVEDL